jgi:hypothetical protein
LATGKNTYTHQDIVREQRAKEADPEKQFTRGTPEAFKKLAIAMPDWTPEFLRSPLKLQNLTQNLTGSLFTQFLPNKEVEGREGPIESNRFLKRFQGTGFVDSPEFRERIQELRREQANRSLDDERFAEDVLRRNKYDRRASVAEARITRNKTLVDRVDEMARAREAGVTREDQMMLQLAPMERAKMVFEQIADMDKDETQKYLRVLRQRKVLSDATLQELRRIQRLITNQ